MVNGVGGEGVCEFEGGAGAGLEIVGPELISIKHEAHGRCSQWRAPASSMSMIYLHIYRIPRDRDGNRPVPRDKIVQVLSLAIAHTLLQHRQYTLSECRVARRTLLLDFPMIAVYTSFSRARCRRGECRVKAVTAKRAAEYSSNPGCSFSGGSRP